MRDGAAKRSIESDLASGYANLCWEVSTGLSGKEFPALEAVAVPTAARDMLTAG